MACFFSINHNFSLIFRFYYIKLPSLRPDSFYFLDLILLPGLFRCKIRRLRPWESKNQRNFSENRIALPGIGIGPKFSSWQAETKYRWLRTYATLMSGGTVWVIQFNSLFHFTQSNTMCLLFFN